jgi:hypothetical protein
LSHDSTLVNFLIGVLRAVVTQLILYTLHATWLVLLGKVCEVLANLHEDILMVAVMDGETASDVYLKKGVPFPQEQAWKQMILKMQIMISLARNTKSFLGAFDHLLLRHEFGDIFVFPISHEKVLFVVAKSASESALVSLIRRNMLIASRE